MRLPDLIIPSGQTLSNVVELVSVDKASVYGAAAFTGAVTIQLSPNGADWFSAGALAAVTKVDIALAEASHIRLSSTLAEGATRTCPLHASGPGYA